MQFEYSFKYRIEKPSISIFIDSTGFFKKKIQQLDYKLKLLFPPKINKLIKTRGKTWPHLTSNVAQVSLQECSSVKSQAEGTRIGENFSHVERSLLTDTSYENPRDARPNPRSTPLISSLTFQRTCPRVYSSSSSNGGLIRKTCDSFKSAST